MREFLDLIGTIISAVLASVIGIIVDGVISYLFESKLIGVILPVLLALIVLFAAIRLITSYTLASIRKEIKAHPSRIFAGKAMHSLRKISTGCPTHQEYMVYIKTII
ncbi:MAG: hypothetical protein OXC41_04870 [Gammaproteobacteria bacterium]|nr:hypothetical protein [Gammaproteobacteria bacterium]